MGSRKTTLALSAEAIFGLMNRSTDIPKSGVLWKRLALWGVILLAAALLCIVVLYYLMLRQPEWYRALERTPRDLKNTQLSAIRAEDTLMNLRNWAADAVAQERRLARQGPASGAAAAFAPSTFVLEFTDADLNAALEKWAETQGWEDIYGQYISRPRLAFRKEGILVAAMLKSLGSVANARLEVRPPEGGQLTFKLATLRAGSVPIPAAVTAGTLTDVGRRVREELITLTDAARAGAAGTATANYSATAAQLGLMLLASLDGTAAPAVVVIPIDNDRFFPAQVVDVRLEGGTVRVVLASMDPGQRAQWIEGLRAVGKSMQSTSGSAAGEANPARPDATVPGK